MRLSGEVDADSAIAAMKADIQTLQDTVAVLQSQQQVMRDEFEHKLEKALNPGQRRAGISACVGRGEEYHEQTLMLAAATEEGNEAATLDSGSLPESIFAFLIYRLLLQSSVKAKVIDIGLLLTFVIAQQSLVSALLMYVPTTLLQSHADADAQSEAMSWSCMSAAVVAEDPAFWPTGDKRLLGQPTGFIISGLIGVGLLSIALKVLDRNNMRMPALPLGSQPSWFIQAVVVSVWYMQGMYTWITLIYIFPILLAMSANSGELVLNMLSGTFILDVDHILYESFVSEECRHTYQASVLRPMLSEAQAELYSTRLCWFALVWMGSAFFFLRFGMDHLVGMSFVESFDTFAKVSLMGAGFCKAVAAYLIYRPPAQALSITLAMKHVAAATVYALVVGPVAGNLVYLFCINNLMGISSSITDPYGALKVQVESCFRATFS